MLVRVSEAAAAVADWFYPRLCPGCGAASDRPERHLCWACFSRLDLHGASVCEQCGAPVEGEVRHQFVCDVCRQLRPAYDRARSAGRFHGVLRAQLHQFKYGQGVWLGRDLADLLLGCLEAHFDPVAVDVVVPVPLHPARLRERSYNQAELLAREVARRLDRRCDARAVARVRRTDTQTRLDAARRRLNMLGAFAVTRPEWVAQRCVLLVDDVMTTGATLDACARALKRAGARTVWAVTVARG